MTHKKPQIAALHKNYYAVFRLIMRGADVDWKFNAKTESVRDRMHFDAKLALIVITAEKLRPRLNRPLSARERRDIEPKLEYFNVIGVRYQNLVQKKIANEEKKDKMQMTFIRKSTMFAKSLRNTLVRSTSVGIDGKKHDTRNNSFTIDGKAYSKVKNKPMLRKSASTIVTGLQTNERPATARISNSRDLSQLLVTKSATLRRSV